MKPRHGTLQWLSQLLAWYAVQRPQRLLFVALSVVWEACPLRSFQVQGQRLRGWTKGFVPARASQSAKRH
jgi:hypothetical protein